MLEHGMNQALSGTHNDIARLMVVMNCRQDPMIDGTTIICDSTTQNLYGWNSVTLLWEDHKRHHEIDQSILFVTFII